MVDLFLGMEGGRAADRPPASPAGNYWTKYGHVLKGTDTDIKMPLESELYSAWLLNTVKNIDNERNGESYANANELEAMCVDCSDGAGNGNHRRRGASRGISVTAGAARPGLFKK